MNFLDEFPEERRYATNQRGVRLVEPFKKGEPLKVKCGRSKFVDSIPYGRTYWQCRYCGGDMTLFLEEVYREHGRKKDIHSPLDK